MRNILIKSIYYVVWVKYIERYYKSVLGEIIEWNYVRDFYDKKFDYYIYYVNVMQC